MKPPLLYTLERTGTNFVSYCFNHLYPNIINTHDKNKNNTSGNDIDYRDYSVFVTVRNPTDTLRSSLLYMIEENQQVDFSDEMIFLSCKELIDRQIFYFKDILDHSDFYIMSFEDFTSNTRNVFLKLASDNNFPEAKIINIQNKSFFENPLDEILSNSTSDKTRFPREKSYIGKDKVDKALELKEIQDYFSLAQSLYIQVMDRYKNQ